MRWLIITVFFIMAGVFQTCRDKPMTVPRYRFADEVMISMKTGGKEILSISDFQYTPEALYVCDAFENGQVFVLDQQGNLIREIGRRGQGPGEYSMPGGVLAVDDRVHIPSGGRQHNLYRIDGSFIQKVSTPAMTGILELCAGFEDGSVFCAAGSRYAPNSIFLLSRDGEVRSQFSPPDKDFVKVFDTFGPETDILRDGDRLVQIFNHRYEVLFWDVNGKKLGVKSLKSPRYIEPDLSKVPNIKDMRDELAYRATFTQFSEIYSWKSGFITVLTGWKEIRESEVTLEFWSHDFEPLGWLKVPEDDKFLGTDGQDRLIFFRLTSESAGLVFRRVKETKEG